jgi:hypothetical protein
MFLGQRIDFNGCHDYWNNKYLYTFIIDKTTNHYYKDNFICRISLLKD